MSQEPRAVSQELKSQLIDEIIEKNYKCQEGIGPIIKIFKKNETDLHQRSGPIVAQTVKQRISGFEEILKKMK